MRQQITITSTQKDLGITISNNNVKYRRLLHLTLVRAHLCYGSQIWAAQSTSKDLIRIGSVQRRATKYVLQVTTPSKLTDSNFFLFTTGIR